MVDKAVVDAIISEARLSDPDDIASVYQVMVNRSIATGKPIEEVIRGGFDGVHQPGSKVPAAQRDPNTRARVEKIISEVEAGKRTTNVGAATHYHTDAVKPHWAPQMTQVTRTNGHVYYEDTSKYPFGGKAGQQRLAETRAARAAPLPAEISLAVSRVREGQPATAAQNAIQQAAPQNMQQRTLTGSRGAYEQSLAVDLASLQYATAGKRNLKVDANLEQALRQGVTSVYGPDYKIEVMSGAQGAGSRGTTGSRRHTTGAAADIWVKAPDGKRLSGDALIPLAQHWLGTGQGSVGFPSNGQSMHLDLVGGRGAGSKPFQGTVEFPVWYYGTPNANQAALKTNVKRTGGTFEYRGGLPRYAVDPGKLTTTQLAYAAPQPRVLPASLQQQRAVPAVMPNLEGMKGRGLPVGTRTASLQPQGGLPKLTPQGLQSLVDRGAVTPMTKARTTAETPLQRLQTGLDAYAPKYQPTAQRVANLGPQVPTPQVRANNLVAPKIGPAQYSPQLTANVNPFGPRVPQTNSPQVYGGANVKVAGVDGRQIGGRAAVPLQPTPTAINQQLTAFRAGGGKFVGDGGARDTLDQRVAQQAAGKRYAAQAPVTQARAIPQLAMREPISPPRLTGTGAAPTPMARPIAARTYAEPVNPQRLTGTGAAPRPMPTIARPPAGTWGDTANAFGRQMNTMGNGMKVLQTAGASLSGQQPQQRAAPANWAQFAVPQRTVAPQPMPAINRGNGLGLPETAARGAITRGADGKSYQYVQTGGAIGGQGSWGWTQVNTGGVRAPQPMPTIQRTAQIAPQPRPTINRAVVAPQPLPTIQRQAATARAPLRMTVSNPNVIRQAAPQPQVRPTPQQQAFAVIAARQQQQSEGGRMASESFQDRYDPNADIRNGTWRD